MPLPMHIQEIYELHIKPLSTVDQLRLVELIAHGLAATVSQDTRHSRSLLHLEGIGEEIWQGIDPQAYVNELRKEWDQHP
jgi:hypothetical protein